jgi:predicted metal-dependent hydrolase
MLKTKKFNPPLSRIHRKLKLRISKRAKRLSLRLDNKTHEMHLIMPARASYNKAYEFARQHKSWIREKLDLLPEPIYLQHGEKIPIFGHNVTIKINYDEELRKTDIVLKNNKLIVSTNKEDPSGRILRFLKECAKEEIKEMAEKKAKKINRKIKGLQVRDTKSRWGSCGPDGKLSFSWRLIFAPYYALDYVVAHEVAHLVHMNHSPKFWELCTRLSTDYSTGKNWMKEHGHTLMRYK